MDKYEIKVWTIAWIGIVGFALVIQWLVNILD